MGPGVPAPLCRGQSCRRCGIRCPGQNIRRIRRGGLSAPMPASDVTGQHFRNHEPQPVHSRAGGCSHSQLSFTVAQHSSGLSRLRVLAFCSSKWCSRRGAPQSGQPSGAGRISSPSSLVSLPEMITLPLRIVRNDMIRLLPVVDALAPDTRRDIGLDGRLLMGPVKGCQDRLSALRGSPTG